MGTRKSGFQTGSTPKLLHYGSVFKVKTGDFKFHECKLAFIPGLWNRFICRPDSHLRRIGYFARLRVVTYPGGGK